MAEVGTQIWSERWRLAALDREDLVKIGLTSIIVGLMYVLFHIQGNTSDVRLFGRSAILWMVNRWMDAASFGGQDYSHGFLIPLVSIGVLWWKRKEIASVPRYVSKAGLAVVVIALLIHWLGAKSQQPRASLFGFWSCSGASRSTSTAGRWRNGSSFPARI